MQINWEQLTKFTAAIDRESPYGIAWFRGFQALAQAQEEPLKEHFEASANGFISAIEATPARPEAFLGLAYLLVLLGDELSANYYAQYVLEHSPDSQEARELAETLESSQKLNSLLLDVHEMSQDAGLEHEFNAPRNPTEEPDLLLAKTELLLDLHHRLVSIELSSGLFKRADQISQRQQSLEVLYEMISDHLNASSLAQAVDTLTDRLQILTDDLENLQNLENLFDSMRIFQKRVQALFRDLTRHTLQLRRQPLANRQEHQGFLSRLEHEQQDLTLKLSQFPDLIAKQIEAASGWGHLQLQTEQFRDLLR